MPEHVYSFGLLQGPDGRISSRPRTYLPIRIRNPHTGQTLMMPGLVDTGADACLLPGWLATHLGHDLKGDGVKSSVTSGIEHHPLTTYKHTSCLELLCPDRQAVVWSSGDVEIECAEPVLPVLLSVDDFLDHFKITIDYRVHELTLHW